MSDNKLLVTVVDHGGQPIDKATVSLETGEVCTMQQKGHQYVLDQVATGQHVVTVELPGWGAAHYAIDVPAQCGVTQHQITLPRPSRSWRRLRPWCRMAACLKSRSTPPLAMGPLTNGTLSASSPQVEGG